MKIRWKPFIIALAVPLLAGGLGALLAGGMDSFEALEKPPLSPPGWLFPAAWTLLYLMMGAARLYAAQLAVNLLWPVLFFRFGLYWAAAVWLLILIVLIAMTYAKFKRLDDLAALLLAPYILWCLFALYLNAGVAVLN